MHAQGQQPLLRAVVQVALDSVPLGLGGCEHLDPRRTQPGGQLLPLGDHDREAESRGHGDDDVQLRCQDALRDRVESERAVVVGHVPDGERGRDHESQGGAALAKPHCAPDQRGEDQVDEWMRGTESGLGRAGEDAHHDGALDPAPAVEPQARELAPGDCERHDDQGSRDVAEEPRSPDMRCGVEGDHVSDPGGRHPDRGADGHSRGQCAEPSRQAVEGVERRARPDKAMQQPGGDDALEDVADRLRERGADRERAVVVDEQVADQDAGPEPEPTQVEKRDPGAGRKPDDRGHRPREADPVADVRCAPVQADEQRHAGREARPRREGARPGGGEVA